MNSAQRNTPGTAGTVRRGGFHNNQQFHNTELPAAKLLNRLDRVRSTGRDQWIARCPAHDDGRPSLSVKELSDGKLLLHCFSGCEAAEVLAAVGLSLADLFPDNGRDHSRRVSPGRRWDYRELLRLLRYESVVVICAANDVVHGNVITEADKNRLIQAATRIARVAEVAK